MPGRPPKDWWEGCTRGVGKSRKVIDPFAVCGSVWARKTPSEKRRIVRDYERDPTMAAKKKAKKTSTKKKAAKKPARKK